MAQEQEARESWRRITLAHELGPGVSSLPDTLPIAPWQPEVPLTSVVALTAVVVVAEVPLTSVVPLTPVVSFEPAVEKFTGKLGVEQPSRIE